MELGIRFPTQEEVVREEAARFRALSPDDKRRSIDDMFRLYHFLLRNGKHPEFAKRRGEEDEMQTRVAIAEAVSRYGR